MTISTEEKVSAMTRLRASIVDNWDHWYTIALSKCDIEWSPVIEPRAYVYYDNKSKRFQIRLSEQLISNPVSLQQWYVKHELWHPLLGHLTTRYHEFLFSDRARVLIASDISIHGCIEVPNELKDTVCTAHMYDLEENKSTEFYYHALEGKKIPQIKTITLDELKDILDKIKEGKNPGEIFGDIIQGSPLEEHELQEFIDSVTRTAGTIPGDLQIALGREKRMNFSVLMKILNQMVDPDGRKGTLKTWAYKNRRNPTFRGHIRRMSANMFLLFDSSGSVFNQQDMNVLASALHGMAEYCKIFVGVCDAALHETFWFRGHLPSITGGGGTVFHEAFALAEEMKFKNMAILTDGYCDYPDSTTVDNVVWGIIDNKKFQPKFGKAVIHIR